MREPHPSAKAPRRGPARVFQTRCAHTGSAALGHLLQDASREHQQCECLTVLRLLIDSRMRKPSFAWVSSLTLGALLMYLLDPTTGRRRRAQLRDRATRVLHDAADACSGLACDLSNRARGVRARLQRRVAVDSVDDTVLEARVRSSLGRVTSTPGAIQVTSVAGIVTLTGPVLAREHDAVFRAVSRVPGVTDVIDRLTMHESAGSISSLQGAASV
jgi:hyperosmotically inducible protein